MFLRIDEHNKDKEALVDNNGVRLTYGQLADAANSISVIPRSVVFVLCRNTAGAVAGYIGLINKNAVPVMLSSKIKDELLANLINTYEPAYIYTPTEDAQRFEGNTDKAFSLFDYTLLKTNNEPYEVNEDLELCMTTSGSTGSPKLVRYKRGNLEANAKNVAIAFGWTEDERAICDLGMQYTMGLNVINTHLYTGATVLLTTHNLMSGDFWDYIKAEKGTNFTGVPFSYDILSRLHVERMELPDLKTFCQGGGRLADGSFKKFAEFAEATGRRFIASFGTTETAARMACLPAELATSKTGSIGYAIPEGEMFIEDGELCYRGPNVTMGYASSKEDLNRGDDFKGEYHTGDLAQQDEDGCFYITGRKSRFLKLLGYRVSLDQTENLIKEKFGIECGCSGNDHQMIIYITDGEKKKEVLDYVSGTTGIYRNLFKVTVTPEILRGDSGKIQYKKMDEIYGGVKQ